MTPTPEPACDIRAQIAAMLDVDHPKQAVLIVSGNDDLVPETLPGVCRVDTSAGVFLTVVPLCADVIRRDASDWRMAWALGYPEDKASVVAACGANAMYLASAVQARDVDGCVVTEAFTSPSMQERTIEEIGRHVPDGGRLVVLTPIEAIVRRVLMRLAESR